MHADIRTYNAAQSAPWKTICAELAGEIDRGLPEAESKLWHGGPVWFLAGNPVAGYWVRKAHVQLLFWSGQSFDESGLRAEGKFKAAEMHYTSLTQIVPEDIARWLQKSRLIQWDYKNIVKRRGRLEKIGDW